jgi:hypothetical protein
VERHSGLGERSQCFINQVRRNPLGIHGRADLVVIHHASHQPDHRSNNADLLLAYWPNIPWHVIQVNTWHLVLVFAVEEIGDTDMKLSRHLFRSLKRFLSVTDPSAAILEVYGHHRSYAPSHLRCDKVIECSADSTAYKWHRQRTGNPEPYLNEEFVCDLHEKLGPEFRRDLQGGCPRHSVSDDGGASRSEIIRA